MSDRTSEGNNSISKTPYLQHKCTVGTKTFGTVGTKIFGTLGTKTFTSVS